MVHFSQGDDVVIWLSHQELTVEMNVDSSEELFQQRVLVQKQQPEEFQQVCPL